MTIGLIKHPLVAGLIGASAGAAMAQFSLSIGGKIDLGVGKYIGEESAGLRDGAGSRLNFRGQEELGDGWYASFALEHRFNAANGQPANPNIFWSGYETVGLGHRTWGSVNLGYQYTAAYSMVQNVIEPWRGDTVAQLRTAWRGGIAKTRVADSVRYDLSYGQTRFAVSTADSDRQGGANGGPDRPFSIGANTRIGPLMLAAGWEDPANPNDQLFNAGATYRIGQANLALGVGRGVTTRKDDFKSVLVAMTYAVGSDEIKAGYVMGTTRRDDGTLVAETRKFGLGYFLWLSKRTYLYTDVAWDGKAERNRFGYDLGLQINF